MIELPSFIDENVWQDWLEYRTQEAGKKNFSERAQRQFLRKCEKLHAEGYDINALIDHAGDVGWLTIWPKDEFKRKSRPASHNTENKLKLVETSDKETAKSALAEMKKVAKRGN